MGILILGIVVAAILFIAAKATENYWKTQFVLRTFAIALTVLMICMGLSMFFLAICADSHIESQRMQYEMLVYQLEHGVYTSDVMEAVYDYNSEVVSNRELSKSAWVGRCYPGDWESLPLIRLEDYQRYY